MGLKEKKRVQNEWVDGLKDKQAVKGGNEQVGHIKRGRRSATKNS